MLKSIGDGLLKNSSVSVPLLLPFLHLLISSNALVSAVGLHILYTHKLTYLVDASTTETDQRVNQWKTAAEVAAARYLLPSLPAPAAAEGILIFFSCVTFGR